MMGTRYCFSYSEFTDADSHFKTACDSEHIEGMEEALANGADADKALEYCARHSCSGIVKWLIEYSADLKAQNTAPGTASAKKHNASGSKLANAFNRATQHGAAADDNNIKAQPSGEISNPNPDKETKITSASPAEDRKDPKPGALATRRRVK